MESVTVITEPLLSRDFVQFEIVVPLLERLRHRYDLTVASPRISAGVQRELEERGIRAVSGGAVFPPLRRTRDEIPSFIVSWARDAVWGWNRRDLERALEGTKGVRINASMTTAIDADVWLIQSRPMSLGLETMRRGVNLPLRVALAPTVPILGPLDVHHLLEAGRRARVRYTTTHHVANWFQSHGLPIAGVMPMYYRSSIARTTQRPSRDFILTYVGKETDSAALRALLETGLPVTMFGSKSVGWVLKALQLNRYPNARLLGHVSDEELSALYSNARFVAFPFTEEPFGLVPLESMACGTPVLTYNQQGPAESVVDGQTGWLVHSPEEFARRVVERWNAGAPTAMMAERCLLRARMYHLDAVEAGWRNLFEVAIAGPEQPRRASPPAERWVARTPALDAPVAPPAGAYLSPASSLAASPALSVAPRSPEVPSPAPRAYRSGGYLGRSVADEAGGPADGSPATAEDLLRARPSNDDEPSGIATSPRRPNGEGVSSGSL